MQEGKRISLLCVRRGCGAFQIHSEDRNASLIALCVQQAYFERPSGDSRAVLPKMVRRERVSSRPRPPPRVIHLSSHSLVAQTRS